MKLQNWAHASEIFTSIAIVLTLIILIIEVNQNTSTMERQIQVDRLSGITDPYMTSPELTKVYAKVKAVDGPEPIVQAFIERYKLTPEEAVLWSRNVLSTWVEIHSDYISFGESETLENYIRGLWKYPDVQIVFEINEDSMLTPEFISYVESIIGNT